MPPNSSGIVRPKTPSSAIFPITSMRDVVVVEVPLVRVRRRPPPRRSGASRCGSPPGSRRGRHRRPSRRPARPESARRGGRGSPACCPWRSGSRRRRRESARRLARAKAEGGRRTISPWLIGMPPKIWSRYSPSADADEQFLRLAEPALRGQALAHRPRVRAPPRHRSRARRARAPHAARRRASPRRSDRPRRRAPGPPGSPRRRGPRRLPPPPCRGRTGPERVSKGQATRSREAPAVWPGLWCSAA